MSLLSAEGLTGLIFLIFIVMTVTGGVIATSAENLIRSVVGLALCLIGVAGIYYFLGSPFVAMMQILIYVGAICVTIIFAIMLAEPNPNPLSRKQNIFSGAIGLSLAAIILYALAALTGKTDWQPEAVKTAGSVADVGQALLTNYSMVFELISVVLLVAIIGSVALARPGRDKEK